MAWRIVNVTYTLAVNLGEDDDYLLAAGFTHTVESGAGIFSIGSNQVAKVFGQLFAAGTAVDLGVLGSVNNQVFIGSHGSISSDATGVAIWGSAARVTNYGMISTQDVAIKLNGLSAVSTIFNAGVIDSTVNNITGAITIDSQSVGTIRFTNTGTVHADFVYRSQSANAADIITNMGMLDGNIDLGGGFDKYDASRGGIVTGIVFGGAGGDIFVPGSADEMLFGDDDLDYAVFSKTRGVTVNLVDQNENTGTAEGDYYNDIEGIYGSDRGADVLIGDGADNDFRGQFGADTMSGGAGADSLIGGVGKDVLSGGAGSDVFVFTAKIEGGDKIADFGAGSGNNDRFELASFDFGVAVGSLASTAFFRGPTNICTSADHRIIWRTTDNTVWFDSNGNVSGGLTMLADLQAGVTLDFRDFFFV